MVKPSGEQTRKEAEDLARIRRLEDAILALANNANQAGGQQQQQQQQQSTIFDKFARHHPPTYDGVCNPVLLESWIREMEKLFIATQCPEDQKADPGFGWGRFCEALKRWFYPEELRWQKEREFLQLEQGTMSVEAYADKFMELSRFSTTIIPHEALRVRRFEKNLTLKVRTVVVGIPSTTFQQAYDRALSVYASVKAEEAETANRGFKRPFVPQPSYQGAKRPRFVPRPSGPSGGRPYGSPTMVCLKCR
ncbi:hypothetical protein RND81_12G046500 [Saponaria officinalis]|uniref:Retrotransposon gag domain-containing protein n=1 Tax=Saponaria officinalis TaxID=3572 RepID=A0AAW1H6D4_SAPOF